MGLQAQQIMCGKFALPEGTSSSISYPLEATLEGTEFDAVIGED